MALVTAQNLKQVMPGCSDPASWVDPLNQAMDRFEINTPARAAAFLAQIAHESSQLNRLVENLNYSASRLMAVWPSRFPTLAVAQQYAGNPQKLGSFVYAKRLGNGDAASGDGFRFRGRGLIQTTGRANYHAAALALGLPLEDQPDLLATPGPAALSAGQFWQSRGLNQLADRNDDANFVTITVRINGGKNGLPDRRAFWQRAKTALQQASGSVAASSPPSPPQQ
jgi:putative chitinase